MNIYWLRNDLRLNDNAVLLQAVNMSLAQNEPLVFVFTLSQSLKRAELFRTAFVFQSLVQFSKQISFAHFKVYVANTGIVPVVQKLKPQTVFYSEEVASEELNEQNQLKTEASIQLFKTISQWQSPLILEKDLPFSVDNMPFVFTAFRKKIEDRLVWQKPLAAADLSKLQTLSVELDTLSELKTFNGFSIQELSQTRLPFEAGELAGLARLKNYLWETQAVSTYKETRNGLLDLNDSTKFSPWLNVGSLSARTILHELSLYEKEVEKNESTYWVFFELLWRDYFKYFSKKYKNQIFQLAGVTQAQGQKNHQHSFVPVATQKKYFKNEAAFHNWCQGLTKEAFINANMKELLLTGWMSNRGRQNVASYLIHQLNMPWTWGASYFEKALIDYDPDINWGNWLYLSGRGSDPRAREFNIQRQADMYDPLGAYQKKWNS